MHKSYNLSLGRIAAYDDSYNFLPPELGSRQRIERDGNTELHAELHGPKCIDHPRYW